MARAASMSFLSRVTAEKSNNALKKTFPLNSTEKGKKKKRYSDKSIITHEATQNQKRKEEKKSTERKTER